MAEQARRGGADAIVTTAKDAVRLEDAPPFGDLPVIVLAIEARVADEPRLRERLLAAVAEGRVTRERRHALEAAAAAVVSAIVRRLPRRVVLALGRGLGRLWAALDRRHLAIAADNLRRAFPEWDEARVQATALGVYAHFADGAARHPLDGGPPRGGAAGARRGRGPRAHDRPRSPGARRREPDRPPRQLGARRASPRRR